MIIKQKWGSRYYDQIMSILAYIISSDKHYDEKAFINKDDAASTFKDIERYAYVRKYDIERKDFNEKNFSINVCVTDYTLCISDRYFGYAIAGGFYPDFIPDDKSVTNYSAKVLQNSKDYIANKATSKKKLEGEVLARIKTYIDECEKKGVKPVKKSLVTEQHSYELILKVWREYEQAEHETKLNE